MKSLASFRSGYESWLIAVVLAANVVGCGSADEGIGNQQPPTTPPLSDWKTLLTGEWTMPSGTEGYVCVRKTIDEDLFINVFDALNPKGTHHTFLSMGEPSGPDGIAPCNAGENNIQQIFGSGVGGAPLAFPKGVAVNIKKGTQLVLNLHLFNTGQADLSGTSGTRIRTVAQSDAPIIAEHLLGGTIRLDLPAQQMTSTTGYCTMSTDATIFAITPHMHKLGVYAKIVAERAAGGEAVLYDGPYNFEEQKYVSIEPVAVQKGDRVRVECTHNNTTPERVIFGESTLEEMCFAGIYRYPSDASPFMCIR
jgi:Copper type II ascorbate-dependent monooxygenase, C-terminal domain